MEKAENFIACIALALLHCEHDGMGQDAIILNPGLRVLATACVIYKAAQWAGHGALWCYHNL